MSYRGRRNKRDGSVLVFPTALLHEIGYFQGLNTHVEPYVGSIFAPGSCFLMPRAEAEQDEDHKQVIPYALLTHNESVFSYLRGRSSEEGRLVGLRSIGIGGHIDQRDLALPGFERHDISASGDPYGLYTHAVRRELEEEVSIDCEYSDRVAAVLNDDADEVGRVHFGIVHVFTLSQPRVSKRERLVTESRFLPIEELRRSVDEYEGWSQICIRGISEGALRL